MSLRTVVEVALHFESFRNVDLFHQGLYHLRARIYREEAGRQLLASPYGHFRSQAQVDSAKARPNRTDHHHLIPAHVVDDMCTFSTRSFLIRYCEEDVELDDVGQFRMELWSGEEDCGPFVVEVDLMFADLTAHGGADRFGEQPDVESTEFKNVSTLALRIHHAEKGVHEFVPIVFDEYHFCLVNMVVHTAVLDVRPRLRPQDLQLVRRRPPATKGVAASAEGPPQPGGTLGTPVSVSRTPARQGQPHQCQPPLSLGEALFGSVGAPPEELLERVEALYWRHVGTLADSYSKQAAWLERICAKCLSRQQQEVFRDCLHRPELRLPQGMPPGGRLPSHATPQAPTALRESLKARLGPSPTERTVAMHFVHDIDAVSAQIAEVWNQSLGVMSSVCREVAALLRMDWEQCIIDRWAVCIQKDVMSDSIAEPTDKNIGILHGGQAEATRRQLASQPVDWTGPCVEDTTLFPPTSQRPVLFEQRYLPRPPSSKATCDAGASVPSESQRLLPSAPKEYDGVHLFVLVHGFQGNSYDMRLMKNNIALLFPEAICLCSSANEDNTDGDVNEMGIRLAQEVVNYVNDWCPASALGRLSFIAHSMGGLIVRAALPLLSEYSSKMHTMLTFSTPHAGYFMNSLSLFHVGLQILQTWRQSQCLSQISMADHSDPRETFMYKLSKSKGLEFFEHVALVSCPSDQYASFDSARIEIGGMLEKHPSQDAYVSMVRNIWEPVKPERVIRFDVDFSIPEQNLDTFIGRASHIQFLECQPIMKMIIHEYAWLFR